MAKALPKPLDHFLLQADLTVIVPGPLEQDLAEHQAEVATVESAGAAMVYRISEASIRRALDAGRTAGDLHTLFEKHSKTPVPPRTHLPRSTTSPGATANCGSGWPHRFCGVKIRHCWPRPWPHRAPTASSSGCWPHRGGVPGADRRRARGAAGRRDSCRPPRTRPAASSTSGPAARASSHRPGAASTARLHPVRPDARRGRRGAAQGGVRDRSPACVWTRRWPSPSCRTPRSTRPPWSSATSIPPAWPPSEWSPPSMCAAAS